MRPMRIGVMMGGFTSERHVSLESGRNIYNKLAASAVYDPLPVFLSGSIQEHRLFILPIAFLLKDNADDVHEYLLYPEKFKALEELLDIFRGNAKSITETYAKGAIFKPKELTYKSLKAYVDFVFLALHGRPGEDGTIQKFLEDYNIPYNGSGIITTALTIDKYATNRFLAQRGFLVAKQYLVTNESIDKDPTLWINKVEAQLTYPMIAKPVDDGCSTGVVKLLNQEMLCAYIENFKYLGSVDSDSEAKLWSIRNGWPYQRQFLLEEFIGKDADTVCFFEITIGLLTHVGQHNEIIYEIFEPSEVLAASSILSLEEKFLAGVGHNITPARFHVDRNKSESINKIVKREIKNVAMALNLQGYARIDAFVKVNKNDQVEVWIIEINTLPAMTPATCIFHQCVLNGYTPFAFIDAIIQYGLTKRNFQSYK